MTFIDAVGYIPAVVFPAATILQLLHIIRSKSSEGVSVLAWIAFALGNVSLYIYTEKYYELQSIIGLLGTCALQVLIVILILKYRKVTP